jgi:putative phage-type endonuclease
MKLVYTNEELPQRSEEWLAIRNTTIGASEVGSILDLNPYEDAYKVWQYKTNRIKPKKENAAMKRGAELEGDALEAAKKRIKHKNIAQLFAIHPEYTFASASFDGVDLDKKFIIELKCPSKALNFKSIFTDGIPIYYYPQVQWQLMIAKAHWGIDLAYFCSYFPDGAYVTNYNTFKEEQHDMIVIDFNYNEQYCQDAVKVVKTFHKFVQTNHWNHDEYSKVIDLFTSKHYA